MSYVSETELKDYITEAELIQLTDDAGAGTVDTVKITAALAAADSDIDAYAGVRYTLPLATSEKVKQLARDLAIWYLEKRRRRIREDTQKAYDLAFEFLRDLAAGKATLDQPTGAAPQTAAQDVLSSDNDELKFSDDNLDGF